MTTLTNKPVDFAAEAMELHTRLCALHSRLCQEAASEVYTYGHRRTSDPARIARLQRLVNMAADRWRKIMGYPPMYGKGGKR
jgi:hypothetical protein